MKQKLDLVDRKILNLLQENSQLSNASIAEKLGLSASSCWRKINALEQAGVIDRYTIGLNVDLLDLNFEAIVHLQLDRHDQTGIDALSRLLEVRPEIIECFATTGDADYQLRVLCADLEAYNLFLDQVLFQNSSVRSAKTNVVLKRIKQGDKIQL